MRRHPNREQMIAAVVAAWNQIPARDKPDLMLSHPDLYAACSWLAASETVRHEARG